jgi:hypothetical protein
VDKLELFSIMERGLSIWTYGDTRLRKYESALDYSETAQRCTAVVIEMFVWAQLERQESSPGFVMEQNTYNAIFTRLTYMTTMFRRLYDKLIELKHQKEREERENKTKNQ